MGVIKNLLNRVEEFMNRIKILEGKFDRLRMKVDLVNTKPKELPDRSTYKPQQPYLGKEAKDIDEITIEESELPMKDVLTDEVEIIEEKQEDGTIIRRLAFKKRPPYGGKLKLVLSGYKYYSGSGEANIYHEIPIETTEEDKYYIQCIWSRSSLTHPLWSASWGDLNKLHYTSGTYYLVLRQEGGSVWREFKYKIYEVID